MTPIRISKPNGKSWDLTEADVAVLQSALPDSIYIQWSLNDTYQVQFTAWDDGSPAYQLLQIQSLVQVDGQWFVIKQIQPDYSGGINTVAITGTHIALEYLNQHRAYGDLTHAKWKMNGQTLGTDDPDAANNVQLTKVTPQKIIDYFGLKWTQDAGLNFKIHGDFNEAQVNLNQDLQWKEVLDLILSTWSTTVIWPDNQTIHIYSAKEFYQDRGHRIDYLHDTSEVQLSYDSTNLSNGARLVGATYDVTSTVDTGLPTGQISTGGKGAQAVINDAKKYLGVPYVWGGPGGARGGNPFNGMDCSSFVSQVYKDFGINIPAYTVSMEAYGRVINRSEVQTGDMGFYGARGSSYHIAMALDNQTMIYEPQPGEVCKMAPISSYPPTWWERNDQMAAIVNQRDPSTPGPDATAETSTTKSYFMPFWYQNQESVSRWGLYPRDDIVSSTIQDPETMKSYANGQFNVNPEFTLEATTKNIGRPTPGDIMRVEIRPVHYVAKLKLVGYQYYPYSRQTQTQLTYNSNPQTILTYQKAQSASAKAAASQVKEIITRVTDNANTIITADADEMAKIKKITNGGS